MSVSARSVGSVDTLPLVEPFVVEAADAVRRLTREVRIVFAGAALPQLHTLVSDVPLATRQRDQGTALHRQFYDSFSGSLARAYLDLVRDVADRCFDEPLLYQRVPTFRVQLPDNVAVGEFHTDGDYNHQVGELNFWVPLTRAWGTNTLWLADEDGRRSVDLDPGSIFVFDGVRTRHGNLVNRTDFTRVSIDFRILPIREYRPNSKKSVSAGRTLDIGDYFAPLTTRPQDAPSL
jgi:hypothetical protein